LPHLRDVLARVATKPPAWFTPEDARALSWLTLAIKTSTVSTSFSLSLLAPPPVKLSLPVKFVADDPPLPNSSLT
jgi:hypothetical protein